MNRKDDRTLDATSNDEFAVASAMKWFVRVRRTPVSDRDLGDFGKWLMQCDSHRRAWNELSRRLLLQDESIRWKSGGE